MTAGQHAASDGPGGSPRIRVGRALVLVAVAVLVGVIWLRHSGPSGPTTVAAHATTTSQAPTSTSAPTSTPGSTAAVRAPNSFKVLVANGTVASGGGSQHLAGTVSSTLHAKGYDTLAGVNATQAVASSFVYFQPGYNQEAAALAQALSLPVSVVQPMPAQPPVTSLQGANILVVAGPDLARATGATTTPPTASTSTTAHTSSTIATTTTVHR